MAAAVVAPPAEARAVKAAAKAIAKPAAAKAPVSKPVSKAPVKQAATKPKANPIAQPPAKAVPAKNPVSKPPTAKPPVAPAKPPTVPVKPAVPKKVPAPKPPVAKLPGKKPATNPAGDKSVKKPPTTKPPVSKPPVKKPPVAAKKPPVNASSSKKLPAKSGASAAPAGALSCVPKVPVKPARKAGDKVPNQFVVHLKPGVDRAKHLASIKALFAQGASCDGVKSAVTLDFPVFEQLALYGGVFGPSVIAAIKKSPDVSRVTADTLVGSESVLPVVPEGNVTKRALFKFEETKGTWFLARLNSGKESVIKRFKVQNMFGPADENPLNVESFNWRFKNLKNAGKGVNVYLLDSGVNDHDDLEGRIIRRPGANVDPAITNAGPVDTTDPADDTTDSAPGHGTKMAGLIAGKTVGVAKSANIIPVKVGSFATFTQMSIGAGIGFAIEDARGDGGVISGSLKMLRDEDGWMLKLVKYAIKENLHIVNSAGNERQNLCADRIGDADGPITVGASN